MKYCYLCDRAIAKSRMRYTSDLFKWKNKYICSYCANVIKELNTYKCYKSDVLIIREIKFLSSTLHSLAGRYLRGWDREKAYRHDVNFYGSIFYNKRIKRV